MRASDDWVPTQARGGRTDEFGAVARRRARATGTLVAVYQPGAQADGDSGWMTVCEGADGESHGGCISHATRRDATAWAAAPNEWCPYCMGEVEP
jgi:hypothetical protein